MGEDLEALLVAGQFFFHLAHRLPEQYRGFLDAIEHGVEIGLEQSRDACDKCHGGYLLQVELDGEFSLGRCTGWL